MLPSLVVVSAAALLVPRAFRVVELNPASWLADKPPNWVVVKDATAAVFRALSAVVVKFTS